MLIILEQLFRFLLQVGGWPLLLTFCSSIFFDLNHVGQLFGSLKLFNVQANKHASFRIFEVRIHALRRKKRQYICRMIGLGFVCSGSFGRYWFNFYLFFLCLASLSLWICLRSLLFGICVARWNNWNHVQTFSFDRIATFYLSSGFCNSKQWKPTRTSTIYHPIHYQLGPYVAEDAKAVDSW